MSVLLKVENLTAEFKTGKGAFVAVNDVSFDVKEGEVVGLVGESGCGKSVTSLSIMGLLPRRISRISGGSITFLGKDLTKLSPKEFQKIRGKDIAMIFQEPMTSLNPVFTIGCQIGEVLKNHTKLSKKEITEKTVHILKRVGIPRAEAVINQYPHQFSGGMRQRAMIAMAIACGPKLLIADEPTTALDVTIQAQILELLKKLAKEEHMAIVLITHDLGVVAEMCDRVMVMYAGHIVEEAGVEEFFNRPRHPYSKGLIECIPRLGMGDKVLPSIPGYVPHPSDITPGCRFYSRCAVSESKCRDSMPSLVQTEEGHKCRCWKLYEGGEAAV